jgi:hypothetical protein
MAEKDYQIKISVDSSGAVKGIDGVTGALTGLENFTSVNFVIRISHASN